MIEQQTLVDVRVVSEVSNRILRIGAIQVPVGGAEPVQWRD